MEKFFEIFKKNHKTERLELRILEPTIENATLIFDTLKNENPDDYKFMWYSVSHKSHLTESVEETQQRMKLDFESNNGCAYYIFHNGKFVGYQRIHYWADSKTLQCASAWFIKSARSMGFNKEVHNMLEKLGLWYIPLKNHQHNNLIFPETPYHWNQRLRYQYRKTCFGSPTHKSHITQPPRTKVY